MFPLIFISLLFLLLLLCSQPLDFQNNAIVLLYLREYTVSAKFEISTLINP